MITRERRASMEISSLSDEQLIEAHRQAWEEWREAKTRSRRMSEGGKEAAWVIELENEAQKRGIPNSALMQPINNQDKLNKLNKSNKENQGA